ncbi:MAG TPA: hypothetical protein VF616_30060, partial [Duganella sp.]|uniref:hypothetical protein n=1 Tax=Duganella sp. TaxID=1904440 RepID=UPI002ED2DBC4
ALEGQAAHLADVVGVFKLQHEQSRGTAAHQPQARPARRLEIVPPASDAKTTLRHVGRISAA